MAAYWPKTVHRINRINLLGPRQEQYSNRAKKDKEKEQRKREQEHALNKLMSIKKINKNIIPIIR